MLPSEDAQKAQVGSGFDAFLFSCFVNGLLLLGWVAVWWVAIGRRRPAALDRYRLGGLVVVGGFGTAAAHCFGGFGGSSGWDLLVGVVSWGERFGLVYGSR